MKIKEHILQELDSLNESQLQRVDNFINLVKITFNVPNQEFNDLEEIAKLYQEFAEEDSLLAEEGMSEYQELLVKEDLL